MSWNYWRPPLRYIYWPPCPIIPRHFNKKYLNLLLTLYSMILSAKNTWDKNIVYTAVILCSSYETCSSKNDERFCDQTSLKLLRWVRKKCKMQQNLKLFCNDHFNIERKSLYRVFYVLFSLQLFLYCYSFSLNCLFTGVYRITIKI